MRKKRTLKDGKDRFNLRGLVLDLYRLPWSGFFRLIFGENWYALLETDKNYATLEWFCHLFDKPFRYYCVRHIGCLAQAKTPNGILLQPLDSIFVNGEIYLDEVYDRFYKMMQDDIVIDVGAHVGAFTLKAARRVRNGKVVAVEPHPSNYRLLLKNIAFNKLENVIPINSALSNYHGMAKLYLSKDSVQHSLRSTKGKYIEVEVKTLDWLLSELKLSKVNFIKIDVEGAELDVLKGAEKTLEENDVFLAIGAYHTQTEAQELSRFLKRRGFRCALSASRYIYAFKPSISSRVSIC